METRGDPGHGLSLQSCSCDTSSSRCWCVDCNEALCDGCVSAHRRVTVTRSHRILNQPPGDISTPPTKFCKLHPSEPLKLFCFTCHKYTCRDCQLMSHMNHRYQFVSVALDGLKKQLEAWAQPIRAQTGTLRRSLEDIETRLQDIVKGESHLRVELQQSYNTCATLLKNRMDNIMAEVKRVGELERDQIQSRRMKLQHLQHRQLSVTETLEKAKTSSDLTALLTCRTQVETELKDLQDQDLSPLKTMSQMQVITSRTSLETLVNFGELKVSWIPFSVSQTSSQNTPTPTRSLTIAPLTLTCPAPTPLLSAGTANNTASPLIRKSLPTMSSSGHLCPPHTSSSCSSSAAPATLPFLPPPKTLPQTVTPTNTASPFPVNRPSVLSRSSGPSPVCTILNVVKPSGVLNRPAALHQNQPAFVLLNRPTAYQVPVSLYSAGPRSGQTVSHASPGNTLPEQQRNVVSAENTMSVGQSLAAPPNHHKPPDKSCAAASGPLSPQRLVCDGEPSSPSPEKRRQSPVVKAVADSACDLTEQQATLKQQEPTENKPTSTLSEEPEPAGTQSPPKTTDRDEEEPSSVTGQQDCSLNQCQPRVHLRRLPLTLPRPGRPLPGFRLVPGDTEDEVYLEEMDEDSESHADDVSEDGGVSTEPLSSPESPRIMQIASCSACGSANASIICASCGRGYHRDCHVPPVGPDIRPEWICSLCQDLSDPSDPYSSERPPSPQGPCLSLQDQRRCESLLLHLKVEGCARLSEVGCVWSHLTLISERLTLRRSPPYQTPAELLFDVWRLFREMLSSQDSSVVKQLEESFQIRLNETFSPELRASQRPPTSPGTGGGSRVKEMRRKLREFLDLRGTSGAKRKRTNTTPLT